VGSSGDRVVILAGGKGSRLAPYTTVLPKPLMPIGDRAILDVVVRQLGAAGFPEITIAVGYLAHLIEAVFGKGEAHDVRIDYHHETEPLGTAGPFATIEGLSDAPFLALNGDVLTSLDYREFFESHCRSGNAMTIATHGRVVRANYGVLEVEEGGDGIMPVTGYREKPEIPYTVSMGVYALSPEALELVPKGRFDIPDLVLALLDAGLPVGSYAFDGYWLDIGRHDDYEQALVDYETILPRLLG
jgi:NDP-sugar pyrophosphorylase family protein